MDRDTLGEVAGLDGAVAEAVRQRRRLGRLDQVAHVVVHRLAGTLETVAGERVPQLLVVLEREGRARVRLVEDLVQQLPAPGEHVQLELARRALQPRPGDDGAVLVPEPDPPLVLAACVLAQAPGEVAGVPGSTRPEQAPLLER